MNFGLQTMLRAGPEALLGAARTRLAFSAPSMRVMPFQKRLREFSVARQNPVMAPRFTPKGVTRR